MSIYGWADKNRERFMERLHDLYVEFEAPFEVVGISILNADTGEAEYYSAFELDGSALAIDALEDIASDADRLRFEQILKAREIHDEEQMLRRKKLAKLFPVINGGKNERL